jgi:hypothetical protein
VTRRPLTEATVQAVEEAIHALNIHGLEDYDVERIARVAFAAFHPPDPDGPRRLALLTDLASAAFAAPAESWLTQELWERLRAEVPAAHRPDPDQEAPLW